MSYKVFACLDSQQLGNFVTEFLEYRFDKFFLQVSMDKEHLSLTAGLSIKKPIVLQTSFSGKPTCKRVKNAELAYSNCT